MKKRILLLVMAVFMMSFIVGCGNDSEVEGNMEFVEENGLLFYTDLENSPFAKSGLKIEIQKGENGSVTFTKTDLSGNPTVDYYVFDFEKKTMEKYYYVSAMGNGYYVVLDLEGDEGLQMRDQSGEDITERIQSAGRWDASIDGAKEDKKLIEAYFQEYFDMSIEEAIL